MLIKNLARRSGTFKNDQGREINYDNLVFTVEVPDLEHRLVFGPLFEEVKVKYSDFVNSYKGDLKTLEGKDATFFFDAKGRYIGSNIK